MLNLYSARHYQTDEALYANFTKATGIKINRIEAGDEQLLERLKSEGREQPGRRAADRRRGAAVHAAAAGAVPAGQVGGARRAHSRRRCATRTATGSASRAARASSSTTRRCVKPADVATYESLADPKNKGKICTRAGSHPYNLSLVARDDRARRRGEDRGLGEGRGRQPGAHAARRRHRPDQGRGRRRMRRSRCRTPTTTCACCARPSPRNRRWAAKTGVVWPDQASYGTHVNISGAGVLKNAPHRENAIKFLEYLASDQAQALLRRRQQRVAGGQGRRREESGARVAGHVQGRRAADRHARQEHARRAEDRRPRRLEVNASSRRATQLARGDAGRRRRSAPVRGALAPATRHASAPRATARRSAISPDRDDRERRQRGLGEALVVRERVGLRRQRVEIERPQHERRRQLLHHVDEHQQRGRGRAAREQRRVHAQQRAGRARRRGRAPRRPSPA